MNPRYLTEGKRLFDYTHYMDYKSCLDVDNNANRWNSGFVLVQADHYHLMNLQEYGYFDTIYVPHLFRNLSAKGYIEYTNHMIPSRNVASKGRKQRLYIWTEKGVEKFAPITKLWTLELDEFDHLCLLEHEPEGSLPRYSISQINKAIKAVKYQ